MKKVSRPFLLTGLILSLVAFTAYLIYCLYAIIALVTSISIAEGIGGDILDMTLIMTIVMMLVPAIFSLLGLIFSAVSCARINYDPQKFASKKGLVITTFVFNVIEAVLILIGLFSAFNVLSIIMLAVFVLAAVFIMVDVARNKKFLALEQAQPQQTSPEASEAQSPANLQNTEEKNDEKSDQV